MLSLYQYWRRVKRLLIVLGFESFLEKTKASSKVFIALILHAYRSFPAVPLGNRFAMTHVSLCTYLGRRSV